MPIKTEKTITNGYRVPQLQVSTYKQADSIANEGDQKIWSYPDLVLVQYPLKALPRWARPEFQSAIREFNKSTRQRRWTQM
tara:strand:- start:39 stop:281 length:243 start_codon:yes stop_codon:yes gene_type:complete